MSDVIQQSVRDEIRAPTEREIIQWKLEDALRQEEARSWFQSRGWIVGISGIPSLCPLQQYIAVKTGLPAAVHTGVIEVRSTHEPRPWKFSQADLSPRAAWAFRYPGNVDRPFGHIPILGHIPIPWIPVTRGMALRALDRSLVS